MKPIPPSPRHRFAVIGGDLRMSHLARRLAEEGYSVNLLGCGKDPLWGYETDHGLKVCRTLDRVMEDVDVLILPLPTTRDGETIHIPGEDAPRVTFHDLARLMHHTPQLLLYGGKLPEGFTTQEGLTSSEVDRVTDYYDSRLLQLRNARITAEAALMTAMELLDQTILDSRVCVLGYGRIGKRLAELLRGMGADVTVLARGQESLMEALSGGCRPLCLSPPPSEDTLLSILREQLLLFNTIPAPVLPQGCLMSLPPELLMLDLASAPFGVTEACLRELTAGRGPRYLRAPSLPGSYAPHSAGVAIAECVLEHLAGRDFRKATSEKGGDGV